METVAKVSLPADLHYDKSESMKHSTNKTSPLVVIQ
uniref:Uncharacterized protein n=1 Tax=Anguilla anguilla TaxID=7936 RepID=A0A0E9R0K1_ANGAN